MRIFEQQDAARRQSLQLVLLFTGAVLATVAGVHLALALLFAIVERLTGFGLPTGFAAINIGVTLLLVLGGWWIETSNLQRAGGAERLARRLGAREARPGSSEQEQRLLNIVQEVCIAAHMPCPQAMVVPRAEGINAFAAGWHADEAIVAVTDGALEALTRDELQGLVAHECSHLHEGDTRLNMQLAGMVTGLELVWHFGDDVRERGGPLAPLGLAVMAMGSFGWWAGRWLQAAVSRQREYLADARAVQWTRSREGLGGVLRKALSQQMDGAASVRGWDGAARHLLLVPAQPARGHWLDAHPPLQERIQRLYGRAMPALELSAARPHSIPDL